MTIKKQKNAFHPPSSDFLLYNTEDGKTRIEARFQGAPVWLLLNQSVNLFQWDKSVVSKHIRDIFDEGELQRGSIAAKLVNIGKTSQAVAQTQEGKSP